MTHPTEPAAEGGADAGADARLRTLAAFAPVMAAPGFFFGDPFRGLGAEARAFVTAVSDAGWIDGQLDWGRWSGSDEAKRLREDPDAIATASPEQLSRLLTALVRADRFSNGVLVDAHASGLIPRILRRAASLAEQRGLGS